MIFRRRAIFRRIAFGKLIGRRMSVGRGDIRHYYPQARNMAYAAGGLVLRHAARYAMRRFVPY